MSNIYQLKPAPPAMREYDAAIVFCSDTGRDYDHLYLRYEIAACERSLLIAAISDIADDIARYDLEITDFVMGYDSDRGYTELAATFDVRFAYFVELSSECPALEMSDHVLGRHEIYVRSR